MEKVNFLKVLLKNLVFSFLVSSLIGFLFLFIFSSTPDFDTANPNIFYSIVYYLLLTISHNLLFTFFSSSSLLCLIKNIRNSFYLRVPTFFFLPISLSVYIFMTEGFSPHMKFDFIGLAFIYLGVYIFFFIKINLLLRNSLLSKKTNRFYHGR